MLANKIIPSFYIIEVQGKAVGSILPGNFGIDKIQIGSRDFKNDMFATAALSTAMQHITLNPELDKTDATEKLDYNPEFFPTIKPLELTEEQKIALEALQEEADEASIGLAATNQVAVPIPRMFDALGDFVESRWLIESPSFKVLGRVAVNPDKYVHHKAIEIAEKSNPLPVKTGTFSLH